jgi:hypothetical protein
MSIQLRRVLMGQKSDRVVLGSAFVLATQLRILGLPIEMIHLAEFLKAQLLVHAVAALG